LRRRACARADAETRLAQAASHSISCFSASARFFLPVRDRRLSSIVAISSRWRAQVSIRTRRAHLGAHLGVDLAQILGVLPEQLVGQVRRRLDRLRRLTGAEDGDRLGQLPPQNSVGDGRVDLGTSDLSFS
jgi:hypothetical protein